jgi:hypothetical protein
MDSSNGENERKIFNIKILLNTNIPGKASFPLTKSVLYLKDLEGSDSKSEESQYPFFTTDVELPYSDIEALGRKQSVEFFFDKELFRRKIMTISRSKKNAKNDNARKNVITMLSIFFPTSFPIEENISDSFRTKIQELQTVKTKVSILPNFVSKFLFTSENNYSYIRLDGSVYTVVGTIWINDIINHPEYRKLLEFGKGISSWWENEKRVINANISKKKKELEAVIKLNVSKGVANNITNIGKPYIHDKIELIYGTKAENSMDVRINAIFELYFYIKYNKREYSSSRYYSSRDTEIPSEIRSEFGYDKIESIGLNIYKMQKTMEFFDDPSQYTELFEREVKKEEKSIELLKDEEIKSEIQKYRKFLEFLKMAYRFTKEKTSSNPLLKDMIYFYLNSDTEDAIKDKKKKFMANLKLTDDSLINLETFLKTMHDVYVKRQKDKLTYPIEILETGVELVKKGDTENKDKSLSAPSENIDMRKSEFEIQVQLDVVKGILNDETVGKISCIFRDSNLMNAYSSLTDSKHNKFEVNKKRFFVDLDVLQKKQATIDASRKEKSAPKEEKPIKERPVKKGGKTVRRRYKISRRRTRYSM